MVSQATQVESPERCVDEDAAAPEHLRQDVGALTRDIVMLAELQFELLREDVVQTLKKARGAIVLMIVAAIAALACLPVMVLGVAFLLAEAGIHLGFAMLLVSVVVLAASGVTAAMSWTRMRKAATPLGRSQREFRINLNWVKRALGSSGGGHVH